MPVGRHESGAAVFAHDKLAFAYMVSLVRRDLQFRGFRDDRLRSFSLKQEANFLLYRRVLQCDNDALYECLQQQWDTLKRPKRQHHDWSPEQAEAIDIVKKGVSLEDEEDRVNSYRFLYISGPPGSGKSALLLELAIWACRFISVLIICPTG